MELLHKLLGSNHDPEDQTSLGPGEAPVLRQFTQRQAAGQARHDLISAQARRGVDAMQSRIAEINARAAAEHAATDKRTTAETQMLLSELVRDARAQLS